MSSNFVLHPRGNHAHATFAGEKKRRCTPYIGSSNCVDDPEPICTHCVRETLPCTYAKAPSRNSARLADIELSKSDSETIQTSLPDEDTHFIKIPSLTTPIQAFPPAHSDALLDMLQSPPFNYPFSFPDDHTLVSLVSTYFSNVNKFMPLLHRPTFLECIRRQLHMHDHSFASTLLLVCAVGSLYLTDSKQETPGWEWYNQVELCDHPPTQQPTLYDLQSACLAAQFLFHTSHPRVPFNIVSVGLRLAQDINEKHRSTGETVLTAEEELKNRAFAILLVLDIQLRSVLRELAGLKIDIGFDLPAECDDENWHSSGSQLILKQPRNVPSVVAFFNCLLKLHLILETALRLLYIPGVGDIWSIVQDIKSTLDTWFDDIPRHLKWDPYRENVVFFDQSAALYCFYYYTRIMLYRPLIGASGETQSMGIQLVEICNNAARACARVTEIHRRRRPDHPLLFSQDPIFTSATVLVHNILSDKNKNETATEDVVHVRTFMSVLQSQQERWPSSSSLYSVLVQLMSAEHSPSEQSHRLPEYFAHTTLQTPPKTTLKSISPWSTVPVPGKKSLPGPPIRNILPPVFVGDAYISPILVHRPISLPLL
ncbi:hypothetical protein C8R44DRAFT_992672 [Mycena epipterygia]|nr:hypothetical protein C8R44DRAFT_992672 [Mycena epipterygia]